MIPDGDRRHGSVSRDVVYEVVGRRQGYYNVMRVLVLGYDFFGLSHRALRQAPFQHVAESGLAGDDGGDAVPLGGIKMGEVNQRNRHLGPHANVAARLTNRVGSRALVRQPSRVRALARGLFSK